LDTRLFPVRISVAGEAASEHTEASLYAVQHFPGTAKILPFTGGQLAFHRGNVLISKVNDPLLDWFAISGAVDSGQMRAKTLL
jgi:hypothetical protein